jgi:hypothetical protein
MLLRGLKPASFLKVYQRLEKAVVQISGSKWQAIGKISQKSVTQNDTIRTSQNNTLRKYELLFDLQPFNLSSYL